TIGSIGKILGFLKLDLGTILLGHVPEDALCSKQISPGADNRCLDDIDEDRLADRWLMLLDRLITLPGRQDALVIGSIFLGQLLGEEIKVGLAEYLVRRLAKKFAEAVVYKGKSTVGVLAKDVLRQGIDE